MRVFPRIVLALAAAGLLAAQTPEAPPPATIRPPEMRQQRVFLLKYAEPRNVASVLEVFGYGIKANPDLHVVAVSAPPEAMSAIEDAIKRLDVPAAAPHDIDLTVYLLSGEQAAHTMEGDALPPTLQPVAEELRKIFAYKNFRLLDSILLRTQPGNRATANGLIDAHTPYSFTVQPTSVAEDPKGRLIRLDNLKLNMRVNDHDAGILTEITVREGQKVVVGKSNINANESLILVVTAKVTE